MGRRTEYFGEGDVGYELPSGFLRAKCMAQPGLDCIILASKALQPTVDLPAVTNVNGLIGGRPGL